MSGHRRPGRDGPQRRLPGRRVELQAAARGAEEFRAVAVGQGPGHERLRPDPSRGLPAHLERPAAALPARIAYTLTSKPFTTTPAGLWPGTGTTATSRSKPPDPNSASRGGSPEAGTGTGRAGPACSLLAIIAPGRADCHGPSRARRHAGLPRPRPRRPPGSDQAARPPLGRATPLDSAGLVSRASAR
jgi:hypothetical protein